jgi:hypothetical protein
MHRSARTEVSRKLAVSHHGEFVSREREMPSVCSILIGDHPYCFLLNFKYSVFVMVRYSTTDC